MLKVSVISVQAGARVAEVRALPSPVVLTLLSGHSSRLLVQTLPASKLLQPDNRTSLFRTCYIRCVSG